jgi:hypothetical protein
MIGRIVTYILLALAIAFLLSFFLPMLGVGP